MVRFQAIFVLSLTLSLAFCQYRIEFDEHNSPPSITPLDPKDYVYSVPLNQMISKPIIVLIQFMNGSLVTRGPLSSEIFEVSTVDEKTIQSAKNIDLWAIKGGKLCQKTNWGQDYPERLDRKFQRVRCGSSKSRTTLLVQALEGKLILDWIYHEHTSIPENKRVISVYFGKKFLRAHSHAFEITAPAHHLTITRNPPNTITANHDFSISAEIRFENDSIVEVGLDSTLNVDITVPYYYKIFGNELDQRMILKKTKYRLSGNGSSLHQGNYDWIIRKRAKKGRVTFDGIRILDPGIGLKLNLTMSMARDPWLREPQCPHCYDDVLLATVSPDRKEVSFGEPDIFLLKKLLSVKLTTKFDVVEQKLHKLTFDASTRENMKNLEDPTTKLVHITRNTEIPSGMAIIATDNAGRRIYAGKESKFKLTYKTIPQSVCISSDATKQIVGGYGYIIMSICQIIDNVTIEIIPSVRATASFFTPSFKVMGFLTVVHLGDFRYSGDGAQVQSHINSFIRYAADDINKGFMLPFLSRNGFIFRVVPYETESDMYLAYRAMIEMEHTILAKHKTRVIISSTTEAITKVLNPELVEVNALFISTSNTGSMFSNKEHFPLFNRVCWSEEKILESVFIACKDRMWTSLIIVKQKNEPLHEIFYHLTHDMQITIKGTVEIDTSSVIIDEPSYFKREMARIRSYGTSIIFLIASKQYQPYILRAAQLANLDSLHGYQWILYSTYAWNFPFGNEAVCHSGTPCTKAFQSSYLFSETYNISGYHTDDWIRVLDYYFSVDRFKYKGGRVRYRPPEVGAKMALGYDALLLFASTVQKIVSLRETIHGRSLAEKSRNLPVKGLTGNWKLNSNGDRIGFFGFLAQVNPFDPDNPHAPISEMVSFIRSLIYNNDGTQLEIPYKSHRPGVNKDDPKSEAAVPVSRKYNLRIYQSVSGIVDQLTQKISNNPSEPWPSLPYTRKENVVPVFYCEQECGKNLLSPSDINVYDTGRCNIGGRCTCAHGFHGNFCENIDCKCEYGTCLSASHCFCHPGWRGLECNLAICKKCLHGTCTQPESCQCSSASYFGKACDLHIAMVLIPVLLGSIIIGGCITLLVRYLTKHAERNAALANSDWIIEWPTVKSMFTGNLTGSKSSASAESGLRASREMNIFMWKNEKWYGKHINSWTIDSKIPELRLEMVDLIKINHRNLITYGGACLTAPNVYLFMEVADKGSLSDILLSESIDLGWEFKYSFMRDICSGMKFLHEKVTMGSHGRLKSTNCLVDSRWTIRISGFGAHTLRFGRFRLPTEGYGLGDLFWTAPEILQSVSCIDDVKNGTEAGDIYSFAIIVAEILTRATPYDYELNYFVEEVIFDMITNNETHARKAARKTWEEIGGINMFVCRPIIKDEFLPEGSLEKKQLLKMLDEAWNENPAARPAFEKLEIMLTQIHPVKGELIDNLISLLEMYSNNLEMIVIERTKELEVSKARAETLLSQMLPRKVAAELKKGNKVPPEVFSSATVFFSDIVDFGNICEESSPFQIVDLLNETYNAFDEVLDAYDVFKVETISDSYMVVSGVPEKNGIKHAGEIATMALHLMSTVCTFHIPHKPMNVLQLRIGINSGPVVAGVVGVLMPRYCLFGDTVNTAARMYSSSQALCIQTSDSTAELLDEIGGFELECRGQRQVKGRGIMTTYWLWGKEDFDMPMPDQSWAISLSQHKFK